MFLLLSILLLNVYAISIVKKYFEFEYRKRVPLGIYHWEQLAHQQLSNYATHVPSNTRCHFQILLLNDSLVESTISGNLVRSLQPFVRHQMKLCNCHDTIFIHYVPLFTLLHSYTTRRIKRNFLFQNRFFILSIK